jgi:hypothetical protein
VGCIAVPALGSSHIDFTVCIDFWPPINLVACRRARQRGSILGGHQMSINAPKEISCEVATDNTGYRLTSYLQSTYLDSRVLS